MDRIPLCVVLLVSLWELRLKIALTDGFNFT